MVKRIGSDSRFVKVADDIELLPSSMLGETYGRKGMEYKIATLPGVRDEVNDVTDAGYSEASGELYRTKAANAIMGEKVRDSIQVKKQNASGRYVDGYLFLEDMRDGGDAMAIEVGRREFWVEQEDEDGNVQVYRVGAMEGTHILSDAFPGIPWQAVQSHAGGEV